MTGRTIVKAVLTASRRAFFVPRGTYLSLLFSSAALATVGSTISYYLHSVPKVFAESQQSHAGTKAHCNSKLVQTLHCERFLSFASLEHNGEVYMTPADFIKCATGVVQPRYVGRRALTESSIAAMLRGTPSLSHSNPSFFRDLGENGLVSFTEYVFLLSLLTRPKNSLHIAFKMFDQDMNEQVDLLEFKKITAVVSSFSAGDSDPVSKDVDSTETTLIRHLFGRGGSGKLKFEEFSRFVENLQCELLSVEFNHLSASQKYISPSDLGRSLLRFTKFSSAAADKSLSKLATDVSLSGKTVSFDSYKALFNFLYVLDDFSSALQMFLIAKRSISKDEFQRAARAVTGTPLDPVVVDTIFILFDADGDGHLSADEFIEAIRARGLRAYSVQSSITSRFQSFRHCDPTLRFSYWPRYVARLLRFRAVYRKELLGWRFQTEYMFQRPDKKPNEYREESYLPVWRFSEEAPWNIANRLSEFPYPDVTWCVVEPNGKKVAKKLPPLLPEDQTIFKGDRVQVLIGPDKGKIGVVSTVLKMRRMVLVDGLNYRITQPLPDTLRREEMPLCMHTEIALVDPGDSQPCSAVWRYNERGERVRVSVRTGHMIPLPIGARQLDDLTDPKTAVRQSKDTPESVVTQVTFNPADSPGPVTFEEDLSAQYGLPEHEAKPFPTYWY
ncbi:hypothetical protein EG68_06891 [Paragonimus skrjabini miyazakii]|uniref:EF-hand domain-containing protein n=1 Tax=Paragonimus skrjabini miyazakii TaxID=59628 RepID=A0A8S9YVS0_9TREM|nr:hypothetical protein EG68_06891 [Paragonimus skrjabini miyazakii]